MERDIRLDMRISEDERRMLRELADREGLTVSALLRTLFRRAHEERVTRVEAPHP